MKRKKDEYSGQCGCCIYFNSQKGQCTKYSGTAGNTELCPSFVNGDEIYNKCGKENLRIETAFRMHPNVSAFLFAIISLGMNAVIMFFTGFESVFGEPLNKICLFFAPLPFAVALIALVKFLLGLYPYGKAQKEGDEEGIRKGKKKLLVCGILVILGMVLTLVERKYLFSAGTSNSGAPVFGLLFAAAFVFAIGAYILYSFFIEGWINGKHYKWVCATARSGNYKYIRIDKDEDLGRLIENSKQS